MGRRDGSGSPGILQPRLPQLLDTGIGTAPRLGDETLVSQSLSDFIVIRKGLEISDNPDTPLGAIAYANLSTLQALSEKDCANLIGLQRLALRS